MPAPVVISYDSDDETKEPPHGKNVVEKEIDFERYDLEVDLSNMTKVRPGPGNLEFPFIDAPTAPGQLNPSRLR